MPYETIDLRVTDKIARITLNRPAKLNSFTAVMHHELHQALADRELETARVLIIRGAGRGFCAGQDLGERVVATGTAGVDLGDSLDKNFKPVLLALRHSPIPTIACVNGVAAGAGVSLALACDFVIAARSAEFILSFSKIGLIPDAGATWTLPRLVGTARAMGMALLSERVAAEQAAAWGMIWRCVEDAALDGNVEQIAAQLAEAPTRALIRTREVFERAANCSFEEALDLERDIQRELGKSGDYAEGVAAFAAKRPAQFLGH